jgi:hypothetical protein
MRSSITTKIIAAIAATIIAELTDKALNSIGLSEEEARLTRDIIKAVAAAIAALLVESVLSGPSNARINVPFTYFEPMSG